MVDGAAEAAVATVLLPALPPPSPLSPPSPPTDRAGHPHPRRRGPCPGPRARTTPAGYG
eukprot:COSAG01_NODE_4976_length_4577_cov_4.889013_9_plen_59_part_00